MNTFLRSLSIVMLAGVVTLVSACGFGVRGSGRQSGGEIVGDVYLAESGSISVSVALRNALTAQLVRFVSMPEQADTIIVLSNEQLSRRVASVSASGRVSEYELLHAIDLRVLRAADGIDVSEISVDDVQRILADKIDAQNVSVIRDYTYDETDVLAKDDEERILREEMRQELVRHLVLRIFAGVL